MVEQATIKDNRNGRVEEFARFCGTGCFFNGLTEEQTREWFQNSGMQAWVEDGVQAHRAAQELDEDLSKFKGALNS